MADRTNRTQAAPIPETGLALCKRLVVAATMAGGLVGGGGIVGAIGFFRPDVTYMLLGLVPPLFLIGVVLGFLHGAALAWVGRPAACPRGAYLRQLVRGMAWSVPGSVVAAVISFWMAYTTALLNAGRPGWAISVVAGWIAAAGVLFWAGAEVIRALRNAIERWPGWRLGVTVVAGTLVAVFLSLPRWKLELRGADLQLSMLGRSVTALLLTLWVAAPIEILLLRRFRRQPESDGSGFRELEAVPNRRSLREAK